MTSANREHVLENLRELRDWAGYIFESLTVNNPREDSGLLREVVEERALRELREMAWSLRQRLDLVGVEAEYRPFQKTA
jgi:hypothetical protein